MDVNILTALIGVGSGAFGYWFSIFSVQPILRYRDVLNKVHRDFIYYGQVINSEGLNEQMHDLYRERVLANRDSSARLSAAYLELPQWRKNWLENSGLRPKEAAKHLIGFSNTTDYDKSHEIEQAIRRKLGLPQET